MRKYYPYLKDLNFLKDIDKLIVQEQYIKITLLDFVTEEPIRSIEGEVTGGTLTKDGSSSARRSCSLTCIVNSGYNIYDIEASYSINKKVFIEIGIKNTTDSYPQYDTIWFPQGVMIISDFSISAANNGQNTLSLKLKDKIALLDGTIGGMLPATTRFDIETTIVDGSYVNKKVLIYDIILEVVNHFGGEDISNIIISDIPTKAKRLLKWTGDTPLWLVSKTVTVDGVEKVQTTACRQDELEHLSQGSYTGQCFRSGFDVGYTYEDFVYDKELSFNAGTTVTQVLDTIKNWLGNFEYFYDEYGIFHFQEIKNYLNNSKSTYEWTESLTDTDYLYDPSDGKTVYSFDDESNIISISSNPSYGNIKNDYVIIGKSDSQDVIYHLVIDKKPTINKDGYSNILVYKDSTTSNYCLAYPQLLSKEEFNKLTYGEIDQIYAVIDGTQETVNITRNASSTSDFLGEINSIVDKIEANLENASKLSLENIISKISTLSSLNKDSSVHLTSTIKLVIAFLNEYYIQKNKFSSWTLDNRTILSNFCEKAAKELASKSESGIDTSEDLYWAILYVAGYESIDRSCYAKNYFDYREWKTYIESKEKDCYKYFNNFISNQTNSNYNSFKEKADDCISFLTDRINYIYNYLMAIYEEDSDKYNIFLQLYNNLKVLKNIICSMETTAYNLISSNNSATDQIIKPEASTFHSVISSYYVVQPKFYIWNSVKKKFVEVEWTKYYSADGGYGYIDLSNDKVLQYILNNSSSEDPVNLKVNSSWYTTHKEVLSNTYEQIIYEKGSLNAYVAEDWRTEIYLQGIIASQSGTETSKYYSEIYANWPTIYNLNTQTYKTAALVSDDYYSGNTLVINESTWTLDTEDGGSVTITAGGSDSSITIQNNQIVINTVYTNNTITGRYYFDIIDAAGSNWEKYSVSAIGCRRLVVSDEDVNCLFSQTAPDNGFVFISNNSDDDEKSRIIEEMNYLTQIGCSNPIQVNSNIYSYFSTAGSSTGAYDTVRYNLLTHTNYQETINITARPCYYLEPNTLTYVYDYSTGTVGNFSIQSISIPFGISQNMSINATKAIEKI